MSTKDLHKVILLFLLVAASVSVWSSELLVADSPDHTYYVYVCAESDDEVAVVRYGPEGAEVVKTIVVGSLLNYIECMNFNFKLHFQLQH